MTGTMIMQSRHWLVLPTTTNLPSTTANIAPVSTTTNTTTSETMDSKLKMAIDRLRALTAKIQLIENFPHGSIIWSYEHNLMNQIIEGKVWPLISTPEQKFATLPVNLQPVRIIDDSFIYFWIVADGLKIAL